MATKQCCTMTSELAQAAGIKGFPKTDEEVRKAQEALAKDLEKLSLDEHEKVLFDVHGIAQIDDDDPPDEIVESSLLELQQELDSLENKPNYDRAYAVNPAYVEDRAFRLLFLRSFKFRAKDAAALMEQHFKVKAILFGAKEGEDSSKDEILGRDVLLADLTKEDMDNLKTGHSQIFPTRDAAGRTIFTSNKRIMLPHKDGLSVGRGNWYLMMSMVRDEETQKKGIVYVGYNLGDEPSKCEHFQILKASENVRSAIPDRVVGAHFCYDHKSVEKFATGIALYLHKDGRHRFRTHFGNLNLIQFELQTYGIPAQEGPMQVDGTWSTTWHLEWISMQENFEATQAKGNNLNQLARSDGAPKVRTSSETPIVVPGRFDVLFGKSKRERESTGNLRALHLVDLNQDKYESANKFEKTEVAEKIVNIIHDSGGRFLRKDDAGWVEVDHDAAREKISHFFRQNRVKSRRENKTGEPVKKEESIKRTRDEGSESDKRVFVRHDQPDGAIRSIESTTSLPQTASKRVTPTSSPLYTPEISEE